MKLLFISIGYLSSIEHELERIIQEEQTGLSKIQEMGISRFIQLTGKQMTEDCKQCEICGFDCYLSGLMCDCSSYAIFCIQHLQEVDLSYILLSHSSFTILTF